MGVRKVMHSGRESESECGWERLGVVWRAVRTTPKVPKGYRIPLPKVQLPRAKAPQGWEQKLWSGTPLRYQVGTGGTDYLGGSRIERARQPIRLPALRIILDFASRTSCRQGTSRRCFNQKDAQFRTYAPVAGRHRAPVLSMYLRVLLAPTVTTRCPQPALNIAGLCATLYLQGSCNKAYL
jgi:hypothetical protein